MHPLPVQAATTGCAIKEKQVVQKYSFRLFQGEETVTTSMIIAEHGTDCGNPVKIKPVSLVGLHCEQSLVKVFLKRGKG